MDDTAAVTAAVVEDRETLCRKQKTITSDQVDIILHYSGTISFWYDMVKMIVDTPRTHFTGTNNVKTVLLGLVVVVVVVGCGCCWMWLLLDVVVGINSKG